MQIFPYTVYYNVQNTVHARTVKIHLWPDEDESASFVRIHTDLKVSDLVEHLKRQDCEVLAIKTLAGAWHQLS